MIRIVKHFALLALVTAAVQCKTPSSGGNVATVKEGYDGSNHPLAQFGVPLLRYDQVPTAANLTRQPWPGYYWATYRGGVAYRWTQYLNFDGNTLGNMSWKDFAYAPMDANAAKNLTDEQIKALSPAEKYDLMQNNYTFPLTARALNDTKSAASSSGNGEVPTWFGICHAWAPASSFTPYPGKLVRVKNNAGQCITFYRDDLKALASLSYDSNYGANYNTMFLGQRCNLSPGTISRDSTGRINNPECRDTNPGAFHLVMSSFLANNKPVMLDVTYSDEVWNQPAYGYSFKYNNLRNAGGFDSLNHVRAQGTVYLVDVEFELKYIVESSPSIGDEQLEGYVQRAQYKYSLELDSGYRVIGGEWDFANMSATGLRLPDFVWTPSEKNANTGDVESQRVDSLIAGSLTDSPDYCQAGTPPPPPEPTPDQPVPTDPDTGSGSGDGNTGGGGSDGGGSVVAPEPTQPDQPGNPQRPPLPRLKKKKEQKPTNTDPKNQQWEYTQPPKRWEYKPYLDPNDACVKQDSKLECGHTPGCAWSSAVKLCLNMRSTKCSDYPAEDACNVKDICSWTGKVCESKEVLHKRKNKKLQGQTQQQQP